MSYEYVIKAGNYVLTDNDEPIAPPLDIVSIAFSNDGDMMTLHKHGDPDIVEKWHSDAVAKYTQAGLQDMANDLHAVTGRFNLNELNSAINNSGYMSRFLKNHNIELDGKITVYDKRPKQGFEHGDKEMENNDEYSPMRMS